MMDEATARAVLGPRIADGQIWSTGRLGMRWPTGVTGQLIYLEGRLSADQLKAIAWWMENKGTQLE